MQMRVFCRDLSPLSNYFSPLGLGYCREKSRFEQISAWGSKAHRLGPGCLIPLETRQSAVIFIINRSVGRSCRPSWRKRVGFPLIYCAVVYPVSVV